MEQNTQSNLFDGMNKQRLYSLIGAGAGLISLILPWRTLGGFTVANGFNGLGIIALLGVVGVAVATFMGDKTKPYEGQTKQIAMGSFGAIALGGLLTLLTKASIGGGIKMSTSPGIGLFLALAVGVLGILFIMGIVKIPDNKPKV